MLRISLALLAALSLSASAHAQSSFAVYHVGGDADDDTLYEAERALVLAIEATGTNAERTLLSCDPADDCLSDVLGSTSSDAVAVITMWGVDETRVQPNVVLTLADSEGLVAVEADVEDTEAGADQAFFAGLLERAMTLWPRRAGVMLELDTLPSGQPVRVDGAFLQTPLSRRLLLGEHEIVVGTENPVRQMVTVDQNSPDVISLVIEADPADIASTETAAESREVVEGPESPEVSTQEESAWPSYLLGGALVAGGIAAWVQPIIALSQNGDCAERCGSETREQYSFGGKEIAFAAIGSAAIVAGVVIMIARPIRLSPSVSPTSAGLTVSGEF